MFFILDMPLPNYDLDVNETDDEAENDITTILMMSSLKSVVHK